MNSLFDFSFNYCILICSFLVPANLLLTLCTIVLVKRLHPPIQIYSSMLAASFSALVLLLHDFTWFAIGVVMAPTYILLVLGCVCLSLNLWAIAHSNNMKQQLNKLLIPQLLD